MSAASVGHSLSQEVSWIVPAEGGTPRDSNRIERIGSHEFRIRASFEEGGQSVLRHAVSRVDLICRNGSSQAIPAEAHLDLSDGGKRTDYDNKPEAGMALRDFVFIQSPGQNWRQVDGSTEGWVATVKFVAEPGETKLGLSPWYTYTDLLRFINGLPAHPHLQKKLIGKSDHGREHWELRITDPSASGPKQTIFWHAREHAYETWSSFAMEGLVEFLLSDGAAEFRRHYLIVIHPMTNLDGVAEGFEYRGGYDFQNPRGTATGQLTFEAMDRLRPDYAVTWHNWVAPRDRNVVFYTDGENGQATARAWLRFTQLFRSLRGAGHRWKDEITPLRYNWEGRQPLSEGNPHQYAMKKYGTRVWGWEMPWWNFSVEDARAMGAQFGDAFLTTLDEIHANRVPPANENPMVEVPRWEMHEFAAKGRAHVNNPFRDAAWVGEFVAPSGKTNVIDGFYDGDDTWRLRFAPNEEGDWTYLLRGEGVEILQRGKVRCTAPRGHGFIGIHPENPYAFAYSDGTQFFPMGDTCYGLYDDSPITPELRAEYLATRRKQNFNFVRMTVGHSEFRAKTNSTYWAWGGTAEKPDLDRLNPVFFRGLDQLFGQLKSNRMNVELILLNFYRRPYTETKLWTAAREQLWLRYITARYGAFNNIFLWTIANEYETHPDGSYRLDFPEDVQWAKKTARFIKSNDPCRHLVTVHPVISASRQGASPRSPIEPPWRIGEFFGDDDAMDVLSQQTGAQGEGTVWDETLQCWTGDSATVAASVKADRRFKKPVLNSENGYEYLGGQPTEKKQVHHTDKVRRTAWRIVCSGGYFAAGFNGTIGHSDIWNRIDAPNHYTFTIKDEGAAAQLGALYEFFNGLPLSRLQPFTGVTGDAVALADPGGIYVVYLPHGGSFTVDFSAATEPLAARWFDPRSGKFNGASKIIQDSQEALRAPDTNDWALLVTLKRGGFAYPAGTANRRFIDQTGKIYLLKTMSSWAMSQNCSDAEITKALEGLKSLRFNAVTVSPFGVHMNDSFGDRYRNKAGESFFAGKPYASSLGPAWSSMDWVMREATRLEMTVVFSFFMSWGDTGTVPDLAAAGTTNAYEFGKAVGNRYANYSNIVWHVMGDFKWRYKEGPGPGLDAIFHGIRDAEGTSHRLIIAEPANGSTSYDQFISAEGPDGYKWFKQSAETIYNYGSSSAEQFDKIYNRPGAASYPVVDIEPPYVNAPHYKDQQQQELRERNYATFIRGGAGINFGHEKWWPHGVTGLFDGGPGWLGIVNEAPQLEAKYAWTILDDYVGDPTWRPDAGAFLKSGLNSGDDQAASGYSSGAALVYFPTSRPISIDTTKIAKGSKVRLRWYDPTSGNYTMIAPSESKASNRSLSYPSKAHSDGFNDWVLVADAAGD